MVYFVVTTYIDKEKDISDYLQYIEAVRPIVEAHGGRYLARSDRITPLGSKWTPDRAIIIEFDTRAELETCFSSEEYGKITHLRENYVDSRAIIIE